MSKIIAFDLDDVICHRDINFENLGPKKYMKCKPNHQVVSLINQLYENGYVIKIYTARGMTQFSGDVSKVYSHLYQLTNDQLKSWNVNFHELIMGKIHYDLLIDDKALNSHSVTSINDIINFLSLDNKNKK